jgi:F-type H+-transporting ATPase subunit b
MNFDLSHAETWVTIGLLLFFVLLFVLKVPTLIWTQLGDKGAAIRSELDEAVKIRLEAQELLNTIKAQKADAEQRAKDMIKKAEEDAKLLTAQAEANLENSLKRRREQAEQKIAQAALQAEADVKAAATDLAVSMAEKLLLADAMASKTDPRIDDSIEQLKTRIKAS